MGRYLLTTTPENVSYGDLYHISKLTAFKEKFIKSPEKIQPRLSEADVIIMGDSMSRSRLDSPIFGDLLAELTPKTIHTLKSKKGSDPIDYVFLNLFKLNLIKSEKKRLLILESAERYALNRFTNTLLLKERKQRSVLGKFMGLMDGTILNNGDLKYFFENSKLTEPLVIFKNNLFFSLFGTTSLQIGAVSSNPPLLFYRGNVEWSQKKITEFEINKAADNLLELKKVLKEKYNLDIYVVIVPSKYSLYGHLHDSSFQYNQFIPRLHNRLIKIGVQSLDLYTLYKNEKGESGQLLFHPQDSHFTRKGKDILVQNISNYLNDK